MIVEDRVNGKIWFLKCRIIKKFHKNYWNLELEKVSLIQCVVQLGQHSSKFKNLRYPNNLRMIINYGFKACYRLLYQTKILNVFMQMSQEQLQIINFSQKTTGQVKRHYLQFLNVLHLHFLILDMFKEWISFADWSCKTQHHIMLSWWCVFYLEIKIIN